MAGIIYEDLISGLMRELGCTRALALELAETHGAKEVIESGARIEYTGFPITDNDANGYIKMARSIHCGVRRHWSKNLMNLAVRGLPKDMPLGEWRRSLRGIKALYEEREAESKATIKREAVELTQAVIEEGAMKPTPTKDTWDLVTELTGDAKNKNFYMKVVLSWVWDLCETMLRIYYPDDTMDMGYQLQIGLRGIITEECTPDNLERTMARVWGVYTRLIKDGPSFIQP